MLKEIRNPKSTGEGKRRWFTESEFDLFVWESNDGALTGFQLCYQVGTDEHAFTWRDSGSYTHHKVDDGEDSGVDYKESPILVPDGEFDPVALASQFQSKSTNIDPQLSKLIFHKILQYHQD